MSEIVATRLVLQNAATAAANGNAVDLKGESRLVTFYVQGTGTITGGTVKLQTARTTDYSGTWSDMQTITASTLSGGAVQSFHMRRALLAARAPITSEITGGGSVTVEVVAN